MGKKHWNKWNNQTRIATKFGLSLCTVTSAHQYRLELFLCYEEPFFCCFFSVKTKHAADIVYAVCVTLEREETDEQKMPALLTARTQAGMTECASTV